MFKEIVPFAANTRSPFTAISTISAASPATLTAITAALGSVPMCSSAPSRTEALSITRPMPAQRAGRFVPGARRQKTRL